MCCADAGFVATGALLLDLLEQESSVPSLASLLGVVETWAQEYDRAEKLDAVDGCNRAHVLGGALCILLHRCAELEKGAYDLGGALGPARARVLLCEKRLVDYDIEDLLNFVTALQLEFVSLYTLQESAATDDGEAGYWALVNTEDICVRAMAQLGACLAVQHKLPVLPVSTRSTLSALDTLPEVADALSHAPPNALPDSLSPALPASMPASVVRGLVEVDSEGYCSPRIDTVVGLLDALHSVYSLHALLTRATFVPRVAETLLPPQEVVQVHAHHREASNETFFSHSMTSDCVVGSIAQYAHRFAHLFHSVSQTIYYNYPTYARQTQISLALLQKENARPVNLLPLLTELRPDIPVLFEHTGAGWRPQHAKQRWSWVLWSNFVVLVGSDMHAYVAADVRTLLSVAQI